MRCAHFRATLRAILRDSCAMSRGVARHRRYKVGYWDTWVGWDMHPFGVWLAGELWPMQLGDVEPTLSRIAEYAAAAAQFSARNSVRARPAAV